MEHDEVWIVAHNPGITLITIGVLLIAVVAYFLGNLLIGSKRDGGFRAIAFIAGTAFCFLGGIGIKDIGSEGDIFPVIILPILLLCFGLFSIGASLFASNQRIRGIINAMTCGL